jgi:hypothetical protein
VTPARSPVSLSDTPIGFEPEPPERVSVRDP